MSHSALFLVAITHRTAPLNFRERVTLAPETEAELARRLSATGSLREFVILNTCNRVEIYGVALQACAPGEVLGVLGTLRCVDRAEVAQNALSLRGPEVVRHLLDVVAGLDSQILGETEIFGQVKRAYAAALTRGSTGPALNRLFQKAFHVAKYARTHAGLSEGQVSIANIAVELALGIFSDLKQARILLLGIGHMGEKSGKAFHSRGATHLMVSSRTEKPSRLFDAELNASWVPFAERENHLRELDIVICATAAPATVISAAAVRSAMEARPKEPLLFFDLAMPRDVEPAVKELSNVFLYNLDDLGRVAAGNRQTREAEAARCQHVLTERTDCIWRQLHSHLARLPRDEDEPGQTMPILSAATV